MLEDTIDAVSQDERFERLLAELLQAEERGEQLDLTHLLQSAPDLETPLRDYLKLRREFDRLAPGLILRQDAAPGTPDLQPGSRFAGYEIVRELGRGGMGIVYQAWQLTPQREVALKVIRNDRLTALPPAEAAHWVERFRKEAQLVAALEQQPNLVTLYEIGEQDGRHFFTMQLVRGVSLAAWIADCSPLTVPFPPTVGGEGRVRGKFADFQKPVATFLARIARAVHYTHQRGIIHRDLKPNNILLQFPEQSDQSTICNLQSAIPMVTDFGLAKRIDGESAITLSGGPLGTPSYMAPEQARTEKVLSTAVDVYSLGAILYELLTGRPPFRAASPLETVMQVLENEPDRPRLLNARIERDLESICLKCLDKEPARRYGSAEALAEDLERYLRDEPVQACPLSPRHRFRKFARRNRGALTVAAVVVLAAGSLLAGLGWIVRDRSAREAALDGEATRASDEAQSLLRSGQWPEAFPIIERTKTLLMTAGRQGDRIPALLKELARDAEMAQRLEELHSQPGRRGPAPTPFAEPLRLRSHSQSNRPPVDEEIFDHHETAAAYARAFTEYDIDLTVLSVAEAAARIRGCTISLELARALDVWSDVCRRFGQRGPPTWQHLLAVARAADPDPWRNRLRDALEERDLRTLQQLAGEDLRQTESGTLHLLGHALYGLGDTQGAVELWRRAQRQHPGDLWLNESLGFHCYASLRPPNYEGAVRYYTAASAIRPRNPYFFHGMGRALVLKGTLTEAVEAFLRAIELKPDFPEALRDRALANRRLRQQDEAVADFLKAIAATKQLSEKTGPVRPILLGRLLSVSSVAISPDERIAATGGGTQALPDLCIRLVGVSSVAISPDERIAAAGGGTQESPDFSIRLWNMSDAHEIRRLEGHGDRVTGLAFSSDVRFLASASTTDQTVRIWEVATGHQLHCLRDHRARVEHVAFLPGGRHVVSAGNDGRLRLWDVKTGKQVREFVGHQGPVWGVAVSPDGRLIATGGSDRTARLWDSETGEELRQFPEHKDSIYDLAFSPDGRCLLTTDTQANTLRLWDVKTRMELHQFVGHTAPVWYVVFTPDGRRALSSSDDGTIRLWDVETGNQLFCLGCREHADGIAFTRDGRCVICGLPDGVYLLRLP
jgi:serine/threonine-protein kinase